MKNETKIGSIEITIKLNDVVVSEQSTICQLTEMSKPSEEELAAYEQQKKKSDSRSEMLDGLLSVLAPMLNDLPELLEATKKKVAKEAAAKAPKAAAKKIPLNKQSIKPLIKK